MMRQYGAVLSALATAYAVTGWTILLVSVALILAGTLAATLFMLGIGVVVMPLLDALFAAAFAVALVESRIWRAVFATNAVLALLYFLYLLSATRRSR